MCLVLEKSSFVHPDPSPFFPQYIVEQRPCTITVVLLGEHEILHNEKSCIFPNGDRSDGSEGESGICIAFFQILCIIKIFLKFCDSKRKYNCSSFW